MQKRDLTSKLEVLAFLFENEAKNKVGVGLDIFTEKIDCNCYKIWIKNAEGKGIQIKILQILEGVTVFFSLEPARFYNLNISLPFFFNFATRNAFRIENIDNYFKKGAKQRLLDLFQVRIINKINPGINDKKWHFLDISENLLAKISVFLDSKTLWALIRSNQEIYKRFFIRNEFWEGVYHSRFKKTGFKTNMVLWKEAYINKIKGIN